jgi:hypothetical protein
MDGCYCVAKQTFNRAGRQVAGTVAPPAVSAQCKAAHLPHCCQLLLWLQLLAPWL